MTETKSYAIDVKSISEAGEFSGWLAIYHIADQVNDIIMPGSFARSIKSMEAGRKLPILFNHNVDDIVGVWTLLKEVPDKGLYVEGKLAIDTALGARVRSLMKLGALTGLSIGYKVIKSSRGKDNSRILTELKLVEGSVVVFPCSLDAQVTDVKATANTEHSEEEIALENIEITEEKAAKTPSLFAQHLDKVSGYSDRYHEQSKRNSALSSALWNLQNDTDMAKDEKKKAMRSARVDHAHSMADLDDAEMDKPAKKADDFEVETKDAGKAKADMKARMMHKLMMAREHHKNGMKAHADAMECMKDMDMGSDSSGDSGDDAKAAADAAERKQIAVDILAYFKQASPELFVKAETKAEAEQTTLENSKVQPSETQTKQAPEATTEDPDLLHSLREGFKSLDDATETKDSESLDLHSLGFDLSSLL